MSLVSDRSLLTAVFVSRKIILKTMNPFLDTDRLASKYIILELLNFFFHISKKKGLGVIKGHFCLVTLQRWLEIVKRLLQTGMHWQVGGLVGVGGMFGLEGLEVVLLFS